MRFYRKFVAGVLPSVLVLFGCGSNNTASAFKNSKAFDDAPPEIKLMWTEALEAGRTNDFENCKKLLYSLGSAATTPVQQKAVSDALATFDAKFNDCLQKGDPAAQRALDALRKDPPNRVQ